MITIPEGEGNTGRMAMPTPHTATNKWPITPPAFHMFRYQNPDAPEGNLLPSSAIEHSHSQNKIEKAVSAHRTTEAVRNLS